MVAHLVRLRLLMLGNSLRRSVWQIVGLVAALLYGSSVFLAVLMGLSYLGRKDVELAGTILVVVGSLVALAWWFLPLVAFGVDGALDPHRLAVYGIRRRDLLLGIGLSGVVGIPGLVTLLGSVGTALVWVRSPAAFLAAVVCAPLAVTTCVVGSRATTTLLAPLRVSRRFREVAGIVVFLPVIALVPALSWASEQLDTDRLTVTQLGGILGWLPFGAVWAVPGTIAAGRPGEALARFAVAVLVLVVLVGAWAWAHERQVSAPVRGGQHGSRGRGLGLLGRLPATPAWGVAARCLVYWVRDPRYASSLAVVPLLPFLLGFLDRGDGLVLLSLGPLTAFLVGWIISADVAYDHSAFWLHVTSGVSGRADRAGRAGAAGIIGLPVTVALAVGSAVYTGRVDDLPAVLGLTLAVLLCALGLSSVVSARFVYPVPRPGEGPFATPQGSAVASLVTQGVGWLVLLVLVLPTLALVIASLRGEDDAFGWWALVAGLVSGALVLGGGVRLGGRIYDARSAELMQQVLANR